MQGLRKKTIKAYQDLVVQNSSRPVFVITEEAPLEMFERSLDQIYDSEKLNECLNKYMRYYDLNVGRISLLKRHGGSRQITYLPTMHTKALASSGLTLDEQLRIIR